MRHCPSCKQDKSEDDFSRRRTFYKQTTYIHTAAYCKACSAKKAKERYWSNPAHSREINRKARERNPETYARNTRKALLKAKYGLTIEAVEEMNRAQNGYCLICKLKMAKPNVDHCHSTGKIRGLLCHRCNNGLGCFGDSIKNLLGAICYLVKHKTNNKNRTKNEN